LSDVDIVLTTLRYTNEDQLYHTGGSLLYRTRQSVVTDRKMQYDEPMNDTGINIAVKLFQPVDFKFTPKDILPT